MIKFMILDVKKFDIACLDFKGIYECDARDV